MKLKSIAGMLATLLFAFAVVACNNNDKATDAPAESPAAAEESPAG